MELIVRIFNWIHEHDGDPKFIGSVLLVTMVMIAVVAAWDMRRTHHLPGSHFMAKTLLVLSSGMAVASVGILYELVALLLLAVLGTLCVVIRYRVPAYYQARQEIEARNAARVRPPLPTDFR